MIDAFPKETDYQTFEEYTLACSVWIKEHPDAVLLKCKEGEPILFFEDMPPAKGPGHIYSLAGEREYNISGYCEFHFDEIARAFDDEDESDAPQSGQESPNNAQSGDSVGANSESSFDSQSFMEDIWSKADPFKDDDPNKPEPM